MSGGEEHRKQEGGREVWEDRERERVNKTARVNWGERKTRGKWQIM